MAAARGSMKMVNREGESGHPCLVPLCRVNLCEVCPLVMTVAVGEVYSVLTQLINDSPKPNLLRVWMRNDQLTLSKAFSASKVVMMVGWLCVAEWCMILNSLRVLLDECLPFMNPVWSG